MKDMLKFGGILMLVATVAAVGLSAVYGVTQPRILEQKRIELENALASALPGCSSSAIFPVKNAGAVLFYRGYSEPDSVKLVGYAFKTSAVGYSSEIESIIGVDSLGQVLGMKVLSQKETPGLGTKVQEVKYGESDSWFQRQFIGRPAEKVAVDKDGGEIVSITGATISSRAVAKSVVNGYQKLQTQLANH